MFRIDKTTKIFEITRGDRGTLILKNKTGNFSIGDKVKFSIGNVGDYQNVLFQKDFVTLEESDKLIITLTSEDTRFDEPIDEQKEYWYEFEYNGDNTVLGCDDLGDKTLILYPESATKESE